MAGMEQFIPQSRLVGEIDQPTDTKALLAPFSGANPQQLYGILMDPSVQQQMSQFGVHFNPQTIHESPFFNQHFMQQHPQMGGRLFGAMSGAAMTPEAPMVSGAGSGISRAMQGAMGGRQMQQQYQTGQLMAPFQQEAAMIPGMEFQRRQSLLGSMQKEMGQSADIATQAEADKTAYQQQLNQLKGQQLTDKEQADAAKIQATRPTGQVNAIYNPQKTQLARPAPALGGNLFPPNPNYPKSEGGWEQVAPSRAFSPVQQGLAGARGKPTEKDFAALEKNKATMYQQLEREYAPYWNPNPPASTDKPSWKTTAAEKRQELERRKQQLEDYYDQARDRMGAPVLPTTYLGQQPGPQTGNPLVAPQQGGQAQQGQAQGLEDTGHDMPDGTAIFFNRQTNQYTDQQGNPIQQ